MTQWEVDEYDEKVLCIDDINGVKCKYCLLYTSDAADE